MSKNVNSKDMTWNTIMAENWFDEECSKLVLLNQKKDVKLQNLSQMTGYTDTVKSVITVFTRI
jgi:hypothetical protein